MTINLVDTNHDTNHIPTRRFAPGRRNSVPGVLIPMPPEGGSRKPRILSHRAQAGAPRHSPTPRGGALIGGTMPVPCRTASDLLPFGPRGTNMFHVKRRELN